MKELYFKLKQIVDERERIYVRNKPMYNSYMKYSEIAELLPNNTYYQNKLIIEKLIHQGKIIYSPHHRMYKVL